MQNSIQHKYVILTLAFISLSMAAPVSASPIHYDEATDGDIVDIVTTFNLGSGANTFRGTASGSTPALFADFDGFTAIIPDGEIIERISLSVSGTPALDGRFPGQFIWSMVESPYGFCLDKPSDGQAEALIPDSPNCVFRGKAGDFFYDLNDRPATDRVGFGSLPHTVIADYLITINVSGGLATVPLPASLPLLLSGIFALGLARRGKRKITSTS